MSREVCIACGAVCLACESKTRAIHYFLLRLARAQGVEVPVGKAPDGRHLLRGVEAMSAEIATLRAKLAALVEAGTQRALVGHGYSCSCGVCEDFRRALDAAKAVHS